ncbi:hypothetical protein BC828DRAFT_291941 [Blastocladiella britannica]|nr:hypothetical protein BC828DRAFT_291941 [Blastocladiella britannica]
MKQKDVPESTRSRTRIAINSPSRSCPSFSSNTNKSNALMSGYLSFGSYRSTIAWEMAPWEPGSDFTCSYTSAIRSTGSTSTSGPHNNGGSLSSDMPTNATIHGSMQGQLWVATEARISAAMTGSEIRNPDSVIKATSIGPNDRDRTRRTTSSVYSSLRPATARSRTLEALSFAKFAKVFATMAGPQGAGVRSRSRVRRAVRGKSIEGPRRRAYPNIVRSRHAGRLVGRPCYILFQRAPVRRQRQLLEREPRKRFEMK